MNYHSSRCNCSVLGRYIDITSIWKKIQSHCLFYSKYYFLNWISYFASLTSGWKLSITLRVLCFILKRISLPIIIIFKKRFLRNAFMNTAIYIHFKPVCVIFDRGYRDFVETYTLDCFRWHYCISHYSVSLSMKCYRLQNRHFVLYRGAYRTNSHKGSTRRLGILFLIW